MSTAEIACPPLNGLYWVSQIWGVGQWMRLDGRRELRNDPSANVEANLQDAWPGAQSVFGQVQYRCFVEVAANLGCWTAELLQTLKAQQIPRCLITAFEPAPIRRARFAERFIDQTRENLFDFIMEQPHRIGRLTGGAVVLHRELPP